MCVSLRDVDREQASAADSVDGLAALAKQLSADSGSKRNGAMIRGDPYPVLCWSLTETVALGLDFLGPIPGRKR